jgi:acylglycerol lipase
MYKLRTYRQNSQATPPKAVLAMFHGLNSHMNRFGHVAHYLASRNITTVGYDYRGFGKSEGDRGYIENLQTHLSDCEKFIDLVKKIYPETPLFVSGLSLGGLTAYHMSLRHPELFKGAVLLAPALMPSIQHSNKIQMLISFLQILGFLLPNNMKLAKVEPDKITRHPAAIQDLCNDPLFQQDRVKLRTILTLL